MADCMKLPTKWLIALCTLITASIFFSLAACTPNPKLKPLTQSDTILALGDSLTYGTGASRNMDYPSILQYITGINVVNAGVPGNETADVIARLSRLMNEVNPQLTIVCIGGNDMLRQKPDEITKENLHTIIKTLKKAGGQVVIIAVPAPNARYRVPDFYEEVAHEERVPIMTDALADLLRDSKYRSDYIHLNNEGYKQLAVDIKNFLKEKGALENK